MSRFTTKEKTKLVPKLRFPGYINEWERRPLSTVAKIQRGRFSPRPRNDPKFYGGTMPFVQTGDVVNSRGSIQKYTQTLNEEGIKVSKVFPEGSILITIAANIGYTGILSKEMACPDSLIGIITNADTLNVFLNYYLSTQREHMDRVASVGAQKNINIDFLNPYPVSWTSFPEQQKIADFLESVDAWLGNLRQQKTALETYKRGMMQKLFTQQVRFKDEDGNDFSEWEVHAVGEYAEIYQPQTISQSAMGSDAPYKVWGANGIVGNYHEYNHEQPQVIVTCRGSTCGKVNLTGPNVWITGNAMVFNVDESTNIIKQFLYYSLTGDNLDYLISGSGQPQITGSIKSHKMNFPSVKEQQKIADFLTAIDQTITAKAEEITQVEQWKKGLMQKMFV